MRYIRIIFIFSYCSFTYGQEFTTLMPFEGHARGIDIVQTRDQGYILTGNTMDPTAGKGNLILSKLDSVGVVIWKKEVTDPVYSLFGWSVLETDKGYLVMGFADKEQKSIPMVFTFDDEGRLLKQKRMLSEGQGIVWSIIQSRSGRFYGVGEQTTENSLQQIWLFQFDADGNILNQSLEPSPSENQRAFYISELANENLVVTGTNSVSGKDQDDVLIRCYDTDLLVVWSKTMDLNGGRDVGHAVKADQNEIYVYGYSEIGDNIYNPAVLHLDQNGYVLESLSPSMPHTDIRIMNGARVGNAHYVFGYSREREASHFQVSLVEFSADQPHKELFTMGEKGINTGYCIKEVSEATLIMTGALTDVEGGSAQVLVKKVTLN